MNHGIFWPRGAVDRRRNPSGSRLILRRRDFIILLGGAAAAWPLPAGAQQAIKVPTVGFLGANAMAWSPRTSAFVKRLRELGWVENRSITIEFRWDDGRPDRAAEIAAEFVRLKVDVIVTVGSAVAPLRQVTSVIPIVFALANDPIGGGLVASLARPGGNTTGLSSQAPDLAGKRLELFQEVVPRLRRLAVIVDVGYPAAVMEMGEVQAAARTLGIEVKPLEIRRADDIAPAFEALNAEADGLYVVIDTLIVANRARILTLARDARLATIFQQSDFVQAGGFLSSGPSIPDLFRRAAEIVDKILRGAKPADIPVEQPTKFELVINLKTAKALGLEVPQSFLQRADEVIE
jgi:putative tryptophan/tyrosine transport system substrate-binding protein